MPGADHVDRTDRPFVTLDPAGSTDLDQAFAMEPPAPTSCCTTRSPTSASSCSPATRSTSRRGTAALTVYLPDERARLYPAALSEGAASLLPDGPRPAVVFTVRVAEDGAATLDGVERAVVRSRAKLAYDDGATGATCRPSSPSCRGASSPPRTGAARRGSSSRSRSSSASTAAGCCASTPGWPARTTTPACRWRRTWPSPTPCSPPAPGCSASWTSPTDGRRRAAAAHRPGVRPRLAAGHVARRLPTRRCRPTTRGRRRS